MAWTGVIRLGGWVGFMGRGFCRVFRGSGLVGSSRVLSGTGRDCLWRIVVGDLARSFACSVSAANHHWDQYVARDRAA